MNGSVTTSGQEPKHTAKKVLQVVEVLISWLIVVLAALMMFFASFSLLFMDKMDRDVLGYHFLVVQSDSMAATDFQTGDVIISRKVDTATLQEGDIITFISQDSANYGQVVTHKIRGRALDSMGREGFITYGTTTGADDRTVASANYVIGQYQGKISGLGHVVSFLRTGVGFILCVLLPFLLVVAVHGAKVLLTFMRWRREQMQEIEDMHARIDYLKRHIPALRGQYIGEESQALLTEVERLLALEESTPAEKDTSMPRRRTSYSGELSPHTARKKIRRRQAEDDKQRKAARSNRK